ncbi:hypothetical protein E2C01_071623 [Portunus trituberculatus]|uniref:Uncharacterized protein n=1 Tax=Portunus trituberculatus TaxID=210409 RepID=A0A5B7I5E5_PORTR|nr:hypothetical protein [Portunus trituberculatus]
MALRRCTSPGPAQCLPCAGRPLAWAHRHTPTGRPAHPALLHLPDTHTVTEEQTSCWIPRVGL